MCTVLFVCGCAISSSMFEGGKTMAVYHCQEHHHLFSDQKSLGQMADELHNLLDIDDLPGARE